MKIVVTGSLGHISKPLAEELIRKGHDVTIISSKEDRKKDIEALGAKAGIGSVEDAHFLTQTFTGADAVYTMVPPANYFNPHLDITAYWDKMGSSYASAIEASGIPRVVNLSSWGADKSSGTGGILGAHYMEERLDKMAGIQLTHIRPASFYYNLFGQIHAIKAAGMMASNYGGDDVTVLVSPLDIASAVAEELTSPGDKKIHYIASDERTCSEVAHIIGEAIGKPDLQWVLISSDQVQKNLEAAGMPAKTAALVVEIGAAHHSGWISEDYYRNKPAKMGRIKVEDFAKEFAAVYAKS